MAPPARLVAVLLAATVWLSAAALVAAPPAAKAETESPLSPEASLEHFRLAPGLRIELVAAEPEVIDPVAVRFDEQGRMWVVEMRDYPHGPAEGAPPQSRIRLLEDRDGDGRYETAATFADHLLFATGVQPWRGGVIVTLAGRIAYMKDTDGDGRADRDETWFTGFAEENSQLRANRPRFGLDNHVYVANGLRGGNIIDQRRAASPGEQPIPLRDGNKPIALGQMDFRFDPSGTRCEAVSGGGQFSLTFDEFGNRFVCSNRNPLKHVVLEDRYVKRNAFLGVPAVVHDVAAAGEESRVFPISRAWTTSNLHAGQFTAACGVDIYRGDALPAEFRGNGFTCEPTGNLVHREVLRARWSTFTSQPARQGVEFLASPDEWFRPVNLETGPDGALYVVDMYRAVIEHPQFMPDELKNRPDLRYGDDRGRIYRIVAADFKQPAQPAVLAGLASRELVEQLGHAGAWRRETAARLLYERQDNSPLVLQALAELALKKSAPPVARVHALWALDGLGRLSPELVAEALGDPHPRVREHAVRLAERWLRERPALVEQVKELAGDDDARLRFQVALSLGEVPSGEILDPLRQIALAGADDPWTRRAVATAVPERAGELLAALLAASPPLSAESAGQMALLNELAALVGARKQPHEAAGVLAALAEVAKPSADSMSQAPAGQQALQWAVLEGLAQALARRGTSLEGMIAQANRPGLKDVADQLFARAAHVAEDPQQPEALREQAVRLLAYTRFETAAAPLKRLVRAEPSQQLRVRAIEALAVHRDPQIAPLLLADFQSQTPAVRRAVLDAVLAQPARASLLLDEIEAGRIAPAELDRVRADRLTKHADAQVRERARELLADFLPADRKKVLEDYQVVLRMEGDALRGREVFQKNCAACHRIGDIGINVAPDIADSRVKKPEQILADILQPNRAIDSNYISYTVATSDGRVVTGIITNETASSITLRQPENKELTLLRQDVEEIRSSGISLMPEGLEKTIPPEQMADLIAFIKNWRYLDGRTPLRSAAGAAGE